MKWFRFWTEILDDPKIGRLADDEYRAFTYLLAMAAEEEKEGIIPFDPGAIAWRTRLPVDLVNRAIEKLQQLDIISQNGNGWKFIHWTKRQFKSDDKSQYWHDWYERKKASEQSNIGPNIGSNNVPNTVEQIQNRTDTEKNRIEKNIIGENALFQLPDWIRKEDWSLFLSHRKALKVPITKEAYPTFIEKFLRLKTKGYEPHYVIGKMVERAWRWYKPEWDKDSDPMVTKFGEKGARTVKNMQKWLQEEEKNGK